MSRHRRHIVLDGEPAPSPQKGGRAPPILAHIYCGQTAGWIKMTHGMEVGLGPGHSVLDGTQPTVPKRGHSPQFSADFYCGQTAGCIRIPLALGAEVGLSLGDIVLDGDPALPPLKRHTPNFRSMSLSPNGWMDYDATWYGGRPRIRRLCVSRGPSSPRRDGHSSPPPLFAPCLLWLRSPISATGELLFYISQFVNFIAYKF